MANHGNKKTGPFSGPVLAVTTGLEPAATGVTDRHANRAAPRPQPGSTGGTRTPNHPVNSRALYH